MPEALTFTTLPNRGLIKVSGPDRHTFLQGLISNDVNLLDTQPCVYACLLTAQGKFLHDFFLTEKDDIIFIDCEGGARTEDLARRLKMFKLRSKVEIEVEPSHKVYGIYNTSSPGSSGGCTAGFPAFAGNDEIYKDPRHLEMGYRSFTKPTGTEQPFEIWDRHRILLTIPDGSRDMIIEKSTLMESNIDQLNGISFEKGCYVGQELTARMHYRALVKKRLQTVKLNELPEGAELRSSCGDIGIALVKDQ
jgi:tRNA-modifying protein YgfZ